MVFSLKTYQVWSYFNFNHMISFHFDAAGLIEEYDSAKKLLKNKSSALALLVAEYTRRSDSGFGN